MRTTKTSYFKIMLYLSYFTLPPLLLTGCANIMEKLGFDPPNSQACQIAPVLMTNLADNQSTREYMLPDGTRCSFKAIN